MLLLKSGIVRAESVIISQLLASDILQHGIREEIGEKGLVNTHVQYSM